MSNLGEIEVLSVAESTTRGRERLKQLAADCRALCNAIHGAGLELGKNLYEVQRHNLYTFDPAYCETDRTPDGALKATAAWAQREVDPGLSKVHVYRLIAAHRVRMALPRGNARLEPTNEAQLRPLAPLLSEPSTRKRIPDIWGRAVEITKREQPSMTEVKKAAREIVPEAFAQPKKRRRSRDTKKAAQAVERLLDQFDRRTLQRALASKGLN